MAKETTKVAEGQTPDTDYKALFEEMEGKYSSMKASFDKASSEIAEFKRKERERMSEEDKRKAEDAEKDAYYKSLEREVALAKYSEELDDITDTKLKTQITELFADGDIKKALSVFKDWRKKDRDEIKKSIRAELLATNPQPAAQSSAPAFKTKDEILSIKDTAARQKAIAENLHLFN